MNYITASTFDVPLQSAFFSDVGSPYARLEKLIDSRDHHGLPYPLALALVFVTVAKLAGGQEPRGIAQWVALRKGLLRRHVDPERTTSAGG